MSKASQLRFYALPLAMSLIVSGCATVNPYTGEQQTSNATTGAMIGAGVGAIAGATHSSSHRLDKALIGAAAGAALGSGIGYYMDVQETKLRQRLQGTGVSVTRNGENIILNMPNAITFANDATQLNSSAYSVLDSVAIVLKEYPKTRVLVAGHTDSIGSESYNQRLSELRANAVGNYLARGGIAISRLMMMGYGESQPVADNRVESGRSQNRRVEIQLQPL
ncbi:Outer membrane protein OmpA [Allopseudospirillum japonicum]|uniref:Outer membrane protein OmpA n=1 Tax=Allopseudospirillum japonicum TaxID=64971 RepID=A0A1H6QTY0_9GAMM|nr:OmpA family protein [Allopseudospirillum japonicum]SEI47161.1 Outer membrane protein OmpA [Allopseudospirillum japonicum]